MTFSRKHLGNWLRFVHSVNVSDSHLLFYFFFRLSSNNDITSDFILGAVRVLSCASICGFSFSCRPRRTLLCNVQNIEARMVVRCPSQRIHRFFPKLLTSSEDDQLNMQQLHPQMRNRSQLRPWMALTRGEAEAVHESSRLWISMRQLVSTNQELYHHSLDWGQKEHYFKLAYVFHTNNY
ncbi:hypothetical protein DICVIV_01489 [Dictyocaulus viviparus]|uniref:Uncharacterized protein n=1 Tax=Dictyocaulus viviparus TaxID=29172 RepID=A0A0D8Y7X4_DICVI|nr:hypothetical protein DICVIV_01489 [Dictyocaulus viviparus]